MRNKPTSQQAGDELPALRARVAALFASSTSSTSSAIWASSMASCAPPKERPAEESGRRVGQTKWLAHQEGTVAVNPKGKGGEAAYFVHILLLFSPHFFSHLARTLLAFPPLFCPHFGRLFSQISSPQTVSPAKPSSGRLCALHCPLSTVHRPPSTVCWLALQLPFRPTGSGCELASGPFGLAGSLWAAQNGPPAALSWSSAESKKQQAKRSLFASSRLCGGPKVVH